MKILVISGFLGAGKTTFIRELVQRTGQEIAILENEYAAEGIDGGLLNGSLSSDNSSDKPINIWELTEGCICCSTKGDFAASVLTIANTFDPEYLIVEPTGVGMLSNVIASLQQIEYERITLLAPVTIIDGKSLSRYLNEYPDILKDQITAAHTLLVSKMEQADEQELAAIDETLHALNPNAEIFTRHYSTLADDWWFSLLSRTYTGEQLSPVQESAENLPDSFSVRNASMDCPEALILLLEDLIRGQFGNIFRAKGIVKISNHYGQYRQGRQFDQSGQYEYCLQFDVADGRYSVTEAAGQDDGKAVFIGESIARSDLLLRFSFNGISLRRK